LALLMIITHQTCQQTRFLWWFGWIKRIKNRTSKIPLFQSNNLMSYIWLCFRLCKLVKELVNIYIFFMFYFFLPFFQFSCYLT
jgi:hypothetical protein